MPYRENENVLVSKLKTDRFQPKDENTLVSPLYIEKEKKENGLISPLSRL